MKRARNVWGTNYMGTTCILIQFCCEPETTLKINSFFKLLKKEKTSRKEKKVENAYQMHITKWKKQFEKPT